MNGKILWLRKLLQEFKMYSKKIVLFVFLLYTFAVNAQMSEYDLNAPFGWATCSGIESAGDYKIVGGGTEQSNNITLKSDGDGVDMYQKILDAVKNNSIIIFDGSNGAFTISKTIQIKELANRTIVGINDARLCTKFTLTQDVVLMLNAEKVKSATTSKGKGWKLSNGVQVKEKREYLTRQALINYFGDTKEIYRSAGIFSFKQCDNFIIRNIKFIGPGACDVGGSDLVSVSKSTHFWIDHCEFSDGMDGNLDITQSSDFNTISWSVFSYTDKSYDHMNTNLIGASDSENEDYLNTTMANNIWGNRCNQRMPMARAGNVHLINNYYNCQGNSVAVNPRKNSEFLVENCYFEANVKPFSQKDAISYNFYNCYTADEYELPQRGETKVPYTYQKFDVMLVPTELQKYAGATLIAPLSVSY